MTSLKKTANIFSNGSSGFTLIEVLIVVVIIAILGSIAGINYIPFRNKAYDTIALSDTRNLVGSVTDAILSEEDVNYNKIGGGAVGEVDTGGIVRTPVFTLSPGIEAVLTGDSTGGTVFTASLRHIRGTPGKTYDCVVDETTGLIDLP